MNESRKMWLVVEYDWEDRYPHAIASTEEKAWEWIKSRPTKFERDNYTAEEVEYIG